MAASKDPPLVEAIRQAAVLFDGCITSPCSILSVALAHNAVWIGPNDKGLHLQTNSRGDATVESIQAAPASVEYRLYHGDGQVTVEAIEVRLGQLTKPSIPIAYRRVITAFLRQERERLAGPASPANADES